MVRSAGTSTEPGIREQLKQHREASRSSTLVAAGLTFTGGLIETLGVGAVMEKIAQENLVGRGSVLSIMGGLALLSGAVGSGIKAVTEGQQAAALEGVLAAHELQQQPGENTPPGHAQFS